MKAKNPKFTTPEAKKLWRATLENYDLNEHHRHLLQAACECVDRIRAAARVILADGLFLTDRYGQQKCHPGVKVENDNKAMLCRLIREMGLDAESAPDVRLPRR